jgi:hypothetical protein
MSVASSEGGIRMFDFLGINAKTHIPALGEPITGFHVGINGCLQPDALILSPACRSSLEENQIRWQDVDGRSKFSGDGKSLEGGGGSLSRI